MGTRVVFIPATTAILFLVLWPMWKLFLLIIAAEIVIYGLAWLLLPFIMRRMFIDLIIDSGVCVCLGCRRAFGVSPDADQCPQCGGPFETASPAPETKATPPPMSLREFLAMPGDERRALIKSARANATSKERSNALLMLIWASISIVAGVLGLIFDPALNYIGFTAMGMLVLYLHVMYSVMPSLGKQLERIGAEQVAPRL